MNRLERPDELHHPAAVAGGGPSSPEKRLCGSLVYDSSYPEIA
jgi:hypothetical protein